MADLPSAAPNLSERSSAAQGLADLGLTLRDAQVRKFRCQLFGRAVTVEAAGKGVQAGPAEHGGGRQSAVRDCQPAVLGAKLANRSLTSW